MELYPASIDILYDGMKVDYGIYAYHNGKPVLLCKDVVLTSNMIQSLKKAMTNCQNVYMDQVHHDQLIKNTPYFKQAQAKLEKDVGYDVMKDDMESAFGSIVEHGSVYGDSIDNLAQDINKKLDAVDGALIMQCINGMRETDKYLVFQRGEFSGLFENVLRQLGFAYIVQNARLYRLVYHIRRHSAPLSDKTVQKTDIQAVGIEIFISISHSVYALHYQRAVNIIQLFVYILC